MKIRNPITGKIDNTSEAKVLPSEEVEIVEPPKKPKKKKKKPLKKMRGGKVEYKKHGGKVIKPNMSGDDVVRGCYD